MVDFLTRWDPVLERGDWVMESGDLVLDQGLTTEVLIALGTDRLANADDILPAADGNRRGCWRDTPIDTDGQGGAAAPQLVGSRLWLLSRSKAIPQTQVDAESYATEATQYMLDARIVAAIAVSSDLVALNGTNRLEMTLRFSQTSGSTRASHVFDVAWSVTLGAAT